jgi:hypothetical protein
MLLRQPRPSRRPEPPPAARRRPWCLLALGIFAAAVQADTTDTTPDGMLAFFDQAGCPSGWSAFAQADGRLLLGYTNTTEYVAEAAVGTALASATAPTHTHGFSTTVDVGSFGLAATSGGNTSGAAPNSHDVPGSGGSLTVASVTGGTPFIQRTLCRKDETGQYAAPGSADGKAADPSRIEVPRPDGSLALCGTASDPYPMGALAFFSLAQANRNTTGNNYDADPCPAGWLTPTYPDGYQSDWSGSNAYCVRFAFAGVDADGDGKLRGRGADASKISGGYTNELTSWSMTVYQNACGTGTQLDAYSWADEQARSDFNFNFDLASLQVIASGNWSTATGLNAGIFETPGSGPLNYNFYSLQPTGATGATGATGIFLEQLPAGQSVSTTPLGSDKFVTEVAMTYVNGFFLMPFADSVAKASPLIAVGDAVANQGPVAAHQHGLSSSISLSQYDFQLAGGSTEHVGDSGQHDFTATTSTTALGIPYLQLLLCQKCSPMASALPAGLDNLLIHSAAACPGAAQGSQGWTTSTPDHGRLTVAVAPGSANPGTAFGGDALTGPKTLTHTHEFSGKADIGGHGVTGSKGCFISCEKVGESGTYSFSGTTDAQAATAPFLTVGLCRPCGGAGQAACATGD